MAMALRCRKHGEIALVDCERYSGAKNHGRRWRLAFTAISFARFLVSLSNKVFENKNIIVRSLSYVAVDVELDRDPNIPIISADRKTLGNMVREKRSDVLNQFGGVNDLAAILETDVNEGVPGTETDIALRKGLFGSNTFEKPPAKVFLKFVLEALSDPTIIVLLICATFALGFGIKQHGWKDGWFDGGSIIFAVFLVVIISSISNYNQSRQFVKLSAKSGHIKVEVVRGGRRQSISIFDIVVGDLVCLNIGGQVPADGLYLEGTPLMVDESSMTGESDQVEVNHINNPFLLSGTKVMDGCGVMLVTSVGMNTAWGEMMSTVSREVNEETPLQERLNKMTSYIGKIGLTVAVAVLFVLFIRYFTGHTRDEKGNREFKGKKTKLDDVMNAVIGIISAAVTIVVVAIPEGLPLAVTLTLAYSMKKMMRDNAMVRKLSACETMGSATTICTDKTGTLTLNEMKVTKFWLGKEEMKEDTSNIAANIRQLLQQAIGLNTTGNVHRPTCSSPPEISGSPTEKALLLWAVTELDMNVDKLKKCNEIIHVETFNSEKKRSGILIRNDKQKTQTHWKGAAEMILAMCSHYYDKSGTVTAMDDQERRQLDTIISNMAGKSLRCIAFAHKKNEEENENVHLAESSLILLGLVGLKDPCREGVKAAIEACKAAGVNIKMITGDNVHTARAIAIECGILNISESQDIDAVIEGSQFRNYSPEERMEKIDKIKVMARSSPFDKLQMVRSLKEKGHVVAVTGDGTNDAPALKEADIGLSMGIQGTEVAKESSDIVILDDNFTSVMTVLRWGRCVYNNIQKFIQFQLTVNVAALAINFVAALSSGKVPLTAVQLLWVNLIMDTLGALALATEEPSDDLMETPPVGRTKPLITRVMWRNIIAQALYQLTILLVLEFKGRSIFNVSEAVKNTLIFTTFVLCQIFNEFNARKLEKKNIFKGLHKNKLFLAIVGITIALQLIMVELLKKFANTERLNWGQWGACTGLASLSWPIGWLVKCISISGMS